ncbi:14849_t:CDS:1, partial [Funneliformis geosporum]
VERSCNALWPQGQGDDSTICSFNSYNHSVGCSSPSLDVQHKSTSKSEMQLQGKSSNEEIRKPSRISGENAVGPCEQITGNGGEENSSNHGKSHILRSEGERQELLFRDINSRKERRNERRENTSIQNERTSSGRESESDENYVFKCPNREKIDRLLSTLGPLFRVGTLEGSSWKEDYPKTPCYFVLPDSAPKWRFEAFMSPLSYDNRFDSSGNNPTLVIEMIENESDRCRIAKSLNIEIQSGDLQKDNIYQDIMDIAQCGFNHIIVIGSCYCDLIFLDCYERVFRWDAMTEKLWFFGNFFNAASEKPEKQVPWGVSLDGTVWELSGIYAYFACSLS